MSEFTVDDRRIFSKDGTLKTKKEEGEPTGEKPATGPSPEAPEARESAESAETGEKTSGERESGKSGKGSGDARGAFNAEDFAQGFFSTLTSLFIGFATSAMNHMEEDSGEEGGHKRDLKAAKVYIDLLGVLQVKTKGNLDPEEEQLLSALLYDLRIKYVKLTAS
ncbi:MAG: DUF1844 domain-containing protein [Deltaproteobacteria bacterium]|jgi:hypothetical protein|nr:DUF1844 domain-containing protein [Deltaproteobacteria bacterium]